MHLFLFKYYFQAPSSSVIPSVFAFIKARSTGLKYSQIWETMWSDVQLQLSQAK